MDAGSASAMFERNLPSSNDVAAPGGYCAKEIARVVIEGHGQRRRFTSTNWAAVQTQRCTAIHVKMVAPGTPVLFGRDL